MIELLLSVVGQRGVDALAFLLAFALTALMDSVFHDRLPHDHGREEDLPTIFEQYDKLAVDLIRRQKEGKPVTFFHYKLDLNGGPCVYKRLSGCGSGTEYLAVTPTGDLYPCHQFVGHDEFKLGDVFHGVERNDIVEEFKLCNVYAKDKCKDCFARFYCSGGCAANSYQFHGNILDAYDVGCELQRKRVECAIMMKAALADDEEDEAAE